jgi:hypothetical protein
MDYGIWIECLVCSYLRFTISKDNLVQLSGTLFGGAPSSPSPANVPSRSRGVATGKFKFIFQLGLTSRSTRHNVPQNLPR